MSMKPIRARGIIVTLDILLEVMGFPEDCEIGWIGQNDDPFSAKIRIESKLFEEVPVNERVPVYRPLFEMRNGRPKLIDWGKPLE